MIGEVDNIAEFDITRVIRDVVEDGVWCLRVGNYRLL
jgi:hypothetical protein